MCAERTDRFPIEGDRPDDQRTHFERDRDRILYTSALRRLAGVTQVVAAEEGHVFHNRLTHTLEVAQIGRRLAQKLVKEQPREAEQLGVDPEVVEAACLAHDLGHPPFGHVAERELDRLLREEGIADGFEGNAQSFRIVTRLAMRHEGHKGLRLTRATLDAILKYPRLRDLADPSIQKFGAYRTEENHFRFARESHPEANETRGAEAELMDWADDIAYAVHDMEDFYRAGLIPLHLLSERVEERARFADATFARWEELGLRKRYGNQSLRDAFNHMIAELFQRPEIQIPYGGGLRQRGALRGLTSSLINKYVHAIKLRIPTSRDSETVGRDPTADRETILLKELMWHYVIRSPALAAQQRGQVAVVRDLFAIYASAALGGDEDPNLLPLGAQDHLKEATTKEERLRVAVDVICGMSELQAAQMHRRLTGQDSGTILHAILI